MNLIRRARPVAAPAKSTTTVEHAPLAPRPALRSAPPQGRLRTTSAHVREYGVAREEILALLKLISDSNAAIDAAKANADAAHDKIDALMRLHKIDSIDDGHLSAQLRETFSRQGRALDPKRFRAQVTQDVFFECVSVSLAKAQEHMGEKALNAICDITPATSLGVSLSITEIRRKRK